MVNLNNKRNIVIATIGCILVIFIYNTVLMFSGFLQTGDLVSFELEFRSRGRIYYDGFGCVDKWNPLNEDIWSDTRSFNERDISLYIDNSNNKLYIIGTNGFQVISLNKEEQPFITEYSNPDAEKRTDLFLPTSKKRIYGENFVQLYKFEEFSNIDKQTFYNMIQQLDKIDLKILKGWWSDENWPRTKLL